MATVTKYPQSHAAVQNGGWTNPQNVATDNGVYATAVVSSDNMVVSGKFYNFDFQIPSGATINSITANVQRKLSGVSGTSSITIQTLKNGSSVGTDITSTNEPTSDLDGSKVDNGTWTADELNDNTANGFTIFWSVTSSIAPKTHYIDLLTVTVDYTEASTQTPFSFAQII